MNLCTTLVVRLAFASPVRVSESSRFPATQTKTPIVALWEALSGEGLVVMVARIENSKRDPSFFAYQIVVSPAVNVFRMIRVRHHRRQDSLHFAVRSRKAAASLTGFSRAQVRDRTGRCDERSFVHAGAATPREKNAFFRKGSWTPRHC